MMTGRAAAAAPALLLALLAGEPAAAAEGTRCRPVPEAPPPGVRAVPPRGCAQRAAQPKPFADEMPSRRDGFVDLGNGSSLRVGGRVRIDVGGRR
jgi:hypothetical protein